MANAEADYSCSSLCHCSGPGDSEFIIEMTLYGNLFVI